MGYWGWRPLICSVFISVWVVGCTLNATEGAPTLSPTNTPQITLTVRVRQPRPPTQVAQLPTSTPVQLESTPQVALIYQVRPGDTLLGIALDFGVAVAQLQTANPGIDPLQLQVGQQIVIPYANPDAPPSAHSPVAPVSLLLSPVVCYELPTGYVYCLGQVINNHEFPVERVRVRVQLARAGSITEHTIAIQRAIIWPGQSAPYSALFTGTWDEGDSASAFLHTARLVQDETRYVRLMIENEQVERSDGRYVVNFTLYNPSKAVTHPVGVILVVLDSIGNVAGYRVVQTTTGISPDERLPVHIAAITPSQDTNVTHLLYVEARRVN